MPRFRLWRFGLTRNNANLVLVQLCLMIMVASIAQGEVLKVGAGERFKTPCQAINRAHLGDTIEISADSPYVGDVCTINRDRLTLRGVGGRASIAAGGKSEGGKAIWVVSASDTTIENLEFSGAAVSDQNGAAIRLEGKNLTIRHCFFHDNEDGILAGDKPGSTVIIENSEFAHNGTTSGQTHQIYVNHVAHLIVRGNYIHDTVTGHLVKSRATRTDVLYNRLTDENGTGSYEINIPNGGLVYIVGNLVQKSANAENEMMVAFGEEGIATGRGDSFPSATAEQISKLTAKLQELELHFAPQHPEVRRTKAQIEELQKKQQAEEGTQTAQSNPSEKHNAVYAAFNTFISAAPNTRFFALKGAEESVAENNIFIGGTIGIPTASNANSTDARCIVSAQKLDFKLSPHAPCAGAAVSPSWPELKAENEYLHPTAIKPRESIADMGALAK
jgi:Right handed beta helix region